MTYNPNIPLATDLQSVSQGQIKDNFSSCNTTFGIDHYSFADATANIGFHNKVTTPLIAGGTHPTTTTNPILYAKQDSANIGVIQYSRGPSNAVPSPLTELHSGTAPISVSSGSSINILDFTGITRAISTLFVWQASDSSTTFNFFSNIRVMWHLLPTPQPFFRFITTQSTSPNGGLIPVSTGNILQVQNLSGSNLNNVYWTLIFHRIDV